ncbi:hypothetical protein FACS1894151_06020 [Spirochaetia bacterium]|nr:hypothetical protein FACS1894151_06020 [Spirochaetia bacterium]
MTVLLCCIFMLLPFYGFGDDENTNGSYTDSSLFDTEALAGAITGEAPAELLSFNLGDADVSLLLAGFWKASIAAAWGLSFSPLGVSVASTESPFLFTQEADLTLSLWIAERWFVEVSFLDGYNFNTYRAGYQGFPGEIVQYVGIGNTGLNFPLFPYLDLGGDSPSSIGVYGHFGSGDFSLHSLVRYDAASREERVFTGNRERTFSYVPLEYPIRGLSFVLPDENIASVPLVYLEDTKGSLTGSDGHKWRPALPGEYAISARYGLLELNAAPEAKVAVYYPQVYNLGDFSDPSSFLGEIQTFFGDIDLNSYYPQTKTVIIEGNEALVLYEKGTFSPFERQSRYSAPSALSQDAALVRFSTGERESGFEVLLVDTRSPETPVSLLPEITVKQGIYEIFPDSEGTGIENSRRSPAARWPLSGPRDAYPELYLPGTASFTGDLTLRFTNYSGSSSSSGSYSIGMDVVPGSVQVYRSGLPDTQISFDPSSGTVTFANPPGINETIHITYLKRNTENRLGSIAAGVGFIYEPSADTGGIFQARAALGTRWNISSGSYTEEGESSPGSAGLSAGAQWQFDKIKAGVTAGLGFEQPDTTNLYRIAGMENSETVLSLAPDNTFLSNVPAASGTGLYTGLHSENRAALIYRNYRNTAFTGTTTLMPLEWDGATEIPNMNGPYPARDSRLDADILAAEFSLDDEYSWTGFQVPLGADGDTFASVREIEVPFRFYGFKDNQAAQQLSLVIQFGALGAKDSGGSENTQLIVEREISLQETLYDEKIDWYIFPIKFSDDDRKKLGDCRYMRLLIIKKNGVETISGRVLLAPPIVRGGPLSPVTIKDNAVSSDVNDAVHTVERRDSSLESRYGDLIGKLHPKNSAPQRVLEISWDGLASETAAGAHGRTGAIPLSSYRRISFFVKGFEMQNGSTAAPDHSMLRFIVAGGPLSLGVPGETALDVLIPAAAFESGVWSKIEIDYIAKTVSVGGKNITGAELTYNRNALSTIAAPGIIGGGDSTFGAGGKTAYIAVVLQPGAGTVLPAGRFSVDEFILEDAVPSYALNAGASLEWNVPGAVFSIGETPVLEDWTLQSAVESAVRGDPFTADTAASAGAVSRSSMAVKLFGASLSGNLAFYLSDVYSSWNAGHSISRSFGPFSFSESFSAAASAIAGGEVIEHTFAVRLATILDAALDAGFQYQTGKQKRSWKALLGLNAAKAALPFGFTINADAQWVENSAVPENSANYGSSWLQSWTPLVPDTGPAAEGRDMHAAVKLPFSFPSFALNFSLDGLSAFSKTASLTNSELAGHFDTPFTISGWRFLFQGERRVKRSLHKAGNSALDDIGIYAENLGSSGDLLFAIPFYIFFDPEVENKMKNAIALSPSAQLVEQSSFTETFSFSLQLPPRYDLASFFIPRGFQAQIGRDISQKLDTYQDILKLGLILRFSSLNMFGAFGAAPLFSFYQSDEYSNNLEATVSFPRNGEPTYRLQDEQSVVFHGFTGAELSLTNTVTLFSTKWLENLSVIWTVPQDDTLLGRFYGWAVGWMKDQESWPALSTLGSSEYERLRRETLELTLDMSGDKLKSSVILGHESIIRILGMLNLSVFAKLVCTQNFETKLFTFIGTIGTAIAVTF